MKKTIVLIAAFIATMGFSSYAQVNVSINLGSQPVWGPVGYDYVDYYYLPDIDAYYDVPNQQYVYMENNYWVTRPYLPPRYRGYNMYNTYKVVVNEPRPWARNDYYRRQYYSYRGRHDQHLIRDSRDNRYYANPNHPYHNQWQGGGNQGYGNGHNNGYHGNGHQYSYNDHNPHQVYGPAAGNPGQGPRGNYGGGQGNGNQHQGGPGGNGGAQGGNPHQGGPGGGHGGQGNYGGGGHNEGGHGRR